MMANTRSPKSIIKLLSPANPSTILSDRFKFQAVLPKGLDASELKLNLRNEYESHEINLSKLQLEYFNSTEEVEISSDVDVSRMFSNESSDTKVFDLSLSSLVEQDSPQSNTVRIAFEPKSTWDDARGGFLSPCSHYFSGRYLILSGWAAKRGDELESVQIKIGSRRFRNIKLGLFSPNISNNLPNIKETKRAIFTLILKNDFLLRLGKKPKAIYAKCVFKSGEVLELVTSQLKLLSPERRITGEIKSVDYSADGKSVVRGWLAYPGLKQPSFNLSNHPDKLKVKWFRDENAEWRNISFSERRDYGFEFELNSSNSPNMVQVELELEGKNFTFPQVIDLRACAITENKNQILEENLSKLFCSSKRKKQNSILICSHNLSSTEGAPRVISDLAIYLSKKGKEVMLVSAKDGDLRTNLESAGVQVKIIPALNMEARNWLKYSKGFLELSELVEEFAPALILANTIDTFWGPRIAELYDIRSAWCLHESSPIETILSRVDRRLRVQCLETFEKSDKLLFVSQASKEVYRKLINEEDALVVPNGIDLDAWDKQLANCFEGVKEELEFRESLGYEKQDKIILSVGTTTHRKGQDVSISSLKYLDPKFKLCILGARKGDYLRELKYQVIQLGLSERVKFVEETSKVHRYYRIADYALISSREESAPLVSLEAFASHLPLISTSVFGLAEQIEEGVNALVAEVDNPESISLAIRKLEANSSLREKLVKQARLSVKDCFTIQSSQSAFFNIFESLTND